MERQVSFYRSIAWYFWHSGMRAYVRTDHDGPPMQITECRNPPDHMIGKTDLNDAMQEPAGEPMAKPSLLERLGQLFLRRPEGELLSPTNTPTSLTDNIRIAWDGQPFMMTLGKVELEFHPDLGIDGEERGGRTGMDHQGACARRPRPAEVHPYQGEHVDRAGSP